MYTLEPDFPYTMPTASWFRDPRPWEQGGMHYGKVSALSVSFVTERDAAARLLPEPFRVADEPVISVSLAVNEDVAWLAGRAYNLVGVDVAAIFDGEVDRDVHGGFCVVMWENMTEAIIGGRDHSGVPKVFGDIPNPTEEAGSWRGSVSHFGHPIMEMVVSDLTPLPAEGRAELERARHDGNWMNYKYIPRLENDGADVSYAAIYPTSGTCTAAWEGQGTIRFHRSSFEQNPTQYQVINLLADLPIHEVTVARRAVWEPLKCIDRLPRRLR